MLTTPSAATEPVTSPAGADLATVRVSALTSAPIKGLGLSQLDSAEVLSTGMAGDRQFFLADTRGRSFSVTRTGAYAHLRATFTAADRVLSILDGDDVLVADTVRPGGALEPTMTDFFGTRMVAGTPVAGPWSAVLSELAEEQVHLMETVEPNAGVDTHPVTLMGSGSLAALAEQAGSVVDARRFRMNIELTGTGAHVEDTWQGRPLSIGAVRLLAGGPVKRCAATTRHPDTGERDLPTLQLLKDYRGVQTSEGGTGVHFGIYAGVLTPGTIRVGDTVEVSPA